MREFKEFSQLEKFRNCRYKIMHGDVLINMWHNYLRGKKRHYDVIYVSVFG